MNATVATLTAALDADREAASPPATPRALLVYADAVALTGFAFSAVVLSLLTPASAVAAAVVSAVFTGVLVGALVRDARPGIVLGAAQIVFTGTVITYGPALARVVFGG